MKNKQFLKGFKFFFLSALRPQPCLEKMLKVLGSYSSMVKRLLTFQSCAEFAHEVEPAILQLHTDMSRCVKSKIGRIPQMVSSAD